MAWFKRWRPKQDDSPDLSDLDENMSLVRVLITQAVHELIGKMGDHVSPIVTQACLDYEIKLEGDGEMNIHPARQAAMMAELSTNAYMAGVKATLRMLIDHGPDWADKLEKEMRKEIRRNQGEKPDPPASE